MGQYRIAIATSDGQMVDLHFGHCRRFTIVCVDQDSGSWEIEQVRCVEGPSQEGYGHDPAYLEQVSQMLSDCSYLMTSRIGPRPSGVLQRHGISVLQISMPIRPAVEKLNEYRVDLSKRKNTNQKGDQK